MEPRERVKALAKSLKIENPDLKHGQCLDAISRKLGFKNWNVLSAKINEEPNVVEKLLNDRMGA